MDKTEFMNTSKNRIRTEENKMVSIGSEQFKECNEFKYLGSVVTWDNDCSKDIKARISAGNRCYYALGKVMRTRYISKQTKLLIYKTIIKPIVVYGCESWTMTEQQQQQLRRWERKILRKIYGPVKEQNNWRIRSNLELEQVYKEPNIVTSIKIRRLEWVGHLIRMEDERMAKMIFTGTLEGKRDRGRPRLRWLDCIEEDLRKVGIRRWRKRAEDRSDWAIVLKEALAKL